MRRLTLAAAMLSFALTGCQTVYKEVPEITSAEGPSAVRFAGGEALMMSEGAKGTVWLRPVRYYSGSKLFFEVVAFNHTTNPVNFGSENISLQTGEGALLRVSDWDELQHYAHKRNFFGRATSRLTEELTDWHLRRVAHRTPDRALIVRQGDHEFFATYEAIQYQLEDAVVNYSLEALQTTTVDPYTTFGGVVYADKVAVERGVVRELLVNVRFAGEDHRFRLKITTEGTPAPIQVGLPAVAREQIEKQRDKCRTWLWDHPDQPCHPDGPLPPTDR